MGLLELPAPLFASSQVPEKAESVSRTLSGLTGDKSFIHEASEVSRVLLAVYHVLLYRYNPLSSQITVGVFDSSAAPAQANGHSYEHAAENGDACSDRKPDFCSEVSAQLRGTGGGEKADSGWLFADILNQVKDSLEKQPSGPAVGAQTGYEFVRLGGKSTNGRLGIRKEGMSLFLHIVEEPDSSLVVHLHYHPAKYDNYYMEAFLRNYYCLLEAYARRPGLVEDPVHQLPIIAPDDYRALVDSFSGRHVARAPEVNQMPGQVPHEHLVSIIERQCRQNPSAMAVFDLKRSLTYFDLLQRGREVATCLLTTPGLRNLNISEGHPELVGLGMERGCEWVVAMVGVLLAGMAYVPLDPSHPKNRIQNLIEQTELKTVLSTTESYDQFRWIEEGEHARVVLVEDQKGGPINLRAIEKATPRPSDVCFVLFTSGSTGEPKGVMVTHQGVRNLVHAFRPLLAVPAPDVRSQVAPMTFDLHAMDVYCAFDVGAAVAVCSKEELLTDLIGFMRRTKVNGIVCTPTVASLLDPATCPDLKWLALGGEMVPRAMVSKWLVAGRTMIDHFGPTETSIAATAQVWKPGDEVKDHIGRPLPGAHIYIVGPNLEILPIGVAGEVCVAGYHVSAGYLKRPDLTARGYRENPYSLGHHDRRLYRTGDRGRWLPEGNIQLLGRIDFQVKIRGNRVEPEEIEDKMSRVPAVQRCVVVKKSDEKLGEFLAAYLMVDRTDIDEGALRIQIRDTVAAHCPSYMVPSAYVIMESLPLTRSGKVDRKLLPHPDRGSFLSFQGGGVGGGGKGEATTESEPCQTEAEVMTAGVFAGLLGIADVSTIFRTSNFFDLGGNSFSAAQAVAHLLHSFGLPPLSLTIRHFFEHPTVKELAAGLQEKQNALYLQPDTNQQKLVASHVKSPKSPLPRVNGCKSSGGRRAELGEGGVVAGRHRHVQQIVPLSQAQEVMWIVHHVLPKPEVVDMTDVWKVKGQVDPLRLQTALHHLLVRHQALRLRFSSDRTAVAGPSAKLMSMVLDRWNPKNGSGEVSAGYARVAGVVTGLFGPLFLRNMHRILPKVVTQIDQDPTIVPAHLNHIDLSQETERERRWKVENAVANARRPFDMKAASGLLFRGTLITLAPSEHLLVFMYSHLIFDGISASSFYRELQEAYREGSVDHLPPTASYSDYVAWESDWLAAGAEKRETGYWQALLGKDPEQLKLASKLPAKTFVAIPCRGAWMDFTLDSALRLGLERVAHSHGCTLNMALLAAFHMLLHIYSQQRRIIVGMLVGRRPLGEHQQMLGHVADIVPILSDFQPGKVRSAPKPSLHMATDTSKEATMGLSFEDVLLQVKERVLESLENQSVTLKMIVSEVLSHPDFAKAALIQAYFNFLRPGTNSSPNSFSLGEAEATFDLKQSWAREGEAALTPLNLMLRQMADGSIQGRLVYQADVLDRHIMEAMSKQYKIVVEQAGAGQGVDKE